MIDAIMQKIRDRVHGYTQEPEPDQARQLLARTADLMSRIQNMVPGNIAAKSGLTQLQADIKEYLDTLSE